MQKIIFLLFTTSTVLAANPKSIHYSALGNYLVNESGQRTEIQGHPKMVCYRQNNTLHGVFLHAKGSTIWLQVPTIPVSSQPDWKVEIKNPVCDILD